MCKCFQDQNGMRNKEDTTKKHATIGKQHNVMENSEKCWSRLSIRYLTVKKLIWNKFPVSSKNYVDNLQCNNGNLLLIFMQQV